MKYIHIILIMFFTMLPLASNADDHGDNGSADITIDSKDVDSYQYDENDNETIEGDDGDESQYDLEDESQYDLEDESQYDLEVE